MTTRKTHKRRLERASAEIDSRIDWLMSRTYPLTKPERIELRRLLEQTRLERAGLQRRG